MQNTSNKKHTVDKKMLREISQEVFHDASDVNFIFLFLLIYFFFIFEIPRWGFLRAWLNSGRSMGGPGSPSYWVKKKRIADGKKTGRARNKIPPPPPLPLRTEFPVFWEFLIPRNSQKFPIMQITLANWIPRFLGIPRNSQKFPTMQISTDFKSLEFGNFWERKTLVLWGLGIPSNSYEFSPMQTTYNLRRVEFLGISGNWIWGNLNTLRSKLIPRNSQYLECEGFKKRSNFRGFNL